MYIDFLLVAMTIYEVSGIAHTLLAGCYDHNEVIGIAHTLLAGCYDHI